MMKITFLLFREMQIKSTVLDAMAVVNVRVMNPDI